MENQRAITELPLEVLDLIYKYCGDIENKVRLAQASQCLGQAFVHHSRNDFKVIPAGTPIEMDSWRFILPLCGSNVNEFLRSLYNSTDHEMKDLVALHCRNLQRITLRIYPESLDSVVSFITKIKCGLRSADLRYDPNPIKPELVRQLPEMPQLKILRLQHIHTDDVYHLQKFANLEVLDLRYCTTVNIFTICAPLTKLRLLSVFGVSIDSEDTDFESPLMALEELNVLYSDIAIDFPTCPNLKEMTFKEKKIFDSTGSVRRSILKQGESLERLVFVRRYTPYDNQGFLELIRSCRKLRYLKLATQNVKFTHDFVVDIVDILSKNGLTPNDPLEVVIDQYYKFKWLRHWLTLTSGSELLKPRLEYVTSYDL